MQTAPAAAPSVFSFSPTVAAKLLPPDEPSRLSHIQKCRFSRETVDAPEEGIGDSKKLPREYPSSSRTRSPTEVILAQRIVHIEEPLLGIIHEGPLIRVANVQELAKRQNDRV